MYKSLDDLLEELGLKASPSIWRRNWQKAMSAYPADIARIADYGFVRDQNEFLELPEDVLKSFRETLKIVNGSEALRVFCWIWHYNLFNIKAEEIYEIIGWPVPEQLKETFGMFVAFQAVSGLPYARELYMERGFPAEVLNDTFKDLYSNMTDYYGKKGRWGMNVNMLCWMMNHIRGRIFHFGRLNFRLAAFSSDIVVLRNNTGGDITVLAGTGARYRQDGLSDGTNGVFDREWSWESSYYEDGMRIEADTVLQNGRAVKKKTTLLKEYWKTVLAKNDWVLEVHVPFGGKLSPEGCTEGVREAAAFFDRYFPEKDIKAMTCWSWLLDPQLKGILPSGSNVTNFQGRFHLYPVLSDDTQIFEYLFPGVEKDVRKLPENTSLQKAVKAYMLGGGLLHSCAGFILKAEIQ